MARNEPDTCRAIAARAITNVWVVWQPEGIALDDGKEKYLLDVRGDRNPLETITLRPHIDEL